MENKILGLHHITAIAANAQQNYDFYVKVLGLRLVKKTVNFDDPGTYHLYYGDEIGSPGSILTFFPWEGIRPGKPGTGMATEIGYSIPKGSAEAWEARLMQHQVPFQPAVESFGSKILRLQDGDGLLINLVETGDDHRQPWTSTHIGSEMAIRGFHSIVLTLRNKAATEAVITNIFDYEFVAAEGNRYRYRTAAIGTANIIDLVEDPAGEPGVNAAGTNHHVAFRVKDDAILMEFRDRVRKAGLQITEKIDRNYFYSLYFREPGGVLFEIASDNPGFAVDETAEELGTNLMLPPQYEGARGKIEKVLPSLTV